MPGKFSVQVEAEVRYGNGFTLIAAHMSCMNCTRLIQATGMFSTASLAAEKACSWDGCITGKLMLAFACVQCVAPPLPRVSQDTPLECRYQPANCCWPRSCRGSLTLHWSEASNTGRLHIQVTKQKRRKAILVTGRIVVRC
jgi:hypothetical protein